MGSHAKAAHVQIMISGPRIPTKVSVSILKDHERARVEATVGEVDHREPHAAATATRTCGAPCVSRGSARGRPSLCTSVTVIGLNLAAPKERRKMEKTPDATYVHPVA
eukprot:scaffold9759_cov126-Isochrysis_galbana.AAC.2